MERHDGVEADNVLILVSRRVSKLGESISLHGWDGFECTSVLVVWERYRCNVQQNEWDGS